MIGYNFIAFLTMTGPEPILLPYVYSCGWGFTLGWYFTNRMAMFAAMVPKHQEAEISGFILYCGKVLFWLPSLVYTLMNEANVPLQWGGVQLNVYLFIAMIAYR